MKDMQQIGYVLCPNDIGGFDEINYEKPHTLTWHVDKVKGSHVDPKFNNKFSEHCESKYRNYG